MRAAALHTTHLKDDYVITISFPAPRPLKYILSVSNRSAVIIHKQILVFVGYKERTGKKTSR